MKQAIYIQWVLFTIGVCYAFGWIIPKNYEAAVINLVGATIIGAMISLHKEKQRG